MSKTLTFAAILAGRPFSATLLHMIGAALRSAGDAAHGLALRVAKTEEAAATVPQIETVEFHSLHGDAGAPEGALYVNGVLVAILPGVKRL
ncbi:hypothetical protein ACPWT1_20070 [Ramlibacter sp. MMS24-I3-19]|uniref:hypothetical protein n=1 Tax=Ramlibacter sp. MMS24-I3-19 TaxID=3416606 RepID=UPI003CFC6BBC